MRSDNCVSSVARYDLKSTEYALVETITIHPHWYSEAQAGTAKLQLLCLLTEQ